MFLFFQKLSCIVLAARDLKIGCSLVYSWTWEIQFAFIKDKVLQAAFEKR